MCIVSGNTFLLEQREIGPIAPFLQSAREDGIRCQDAIYNITVLYNGAPYVQTVAREFFGSVPYSSPCIVRMYRVGYAYSMSTRIGVSAFSDVFARNVRHVPPLADSKSKWADFGSAKPHWW